MTGKVTVLCLVVFAALVDAMSWTELADMPVALSDMSATAVGPTTILLVGGCDSGQLSCEAYEGCSYCPSISSRSFEYTTNDNLWRELAPAPRARYRHAAAYDEATEAVYVVGGRDLADNLIQQIDMYAVVAGAWTTLSATHATSDLGAFVFAGVLYAYGGYDAEYQAQAAGSAIALATTQVTAAPELIEARGDLGILVYGTTAYAAGGWSHLNWCEPLASVEALDLSVASPSWTPVPAMLVARGDKALAAVDGTLVVVGGEHNNNCATASEPVEDVEVLRDNQWMAVANTPEPKFRGAAAGLDGHVFFFGGQAAIQTNCPDPAQFCFPVTNHTWRLAISSNGQGDDDDDDRAKTSLAVFVVAFLTCCLVLALAMCFCFCFRQRCRSYCCDARTAGAGTRPEKSSQEPAGGKLCPSDNAEQVEMGAAV